MWRIMFKGRDAMYHFWMHVAMLYLCEGSPVGQEIIDDHEEWVDEDGGSEDEDAEEESSGSDSSTDSGVESD